MLKYFVNNLTVNWSLRFENGLCSHLFSLSLEYLMELLEWTPWKICNSEICLIFWKRIYFNETLFWLGGAKARGKNQPLPWTVEQLNIVAEYSSFIRSSWHSTLIILASGAQETKTLKYFAWYHQKIACWQKVDKNFQLCAIITLLSPARHVSTHFSICFISY